MAKGQTLEESFEQLEKIAARMEDGKLSLDESFKLYKEGIKIIQNCNQQIDKVEKQMIVLENNIDNIE